MNEVRPERTGWRDQRLSARHRLWGWDCPFTDIDWLVCEYDHFTPIAIIEYKKEGGRPVTPSSDANCKVLIKLGNMSGLPVFGVRYADDLSWFQVVRLNHVAESKLTARCKMTELEYVTFLYELRGRKVPEDILDALRPKVSIATIAQ